MQLKEERERWGWLLQGSSVCDERWRQFPKECHQSEFKYSNVWDSVGGILFKPLYLVLDIMDYQTYDIYIAKLSMYVYICTYLSNT